MRYTAYGYGRLALAAGFGALFFLAGALILGAEEQKKDKDAKAVFQEMAAAVSKVQDYEAEWSHMSSAAGEGPIRGLMVYRGKFLRSPALYYKKLLSSETNYVDPSTEGTQLIYDSKADVVKVLLPGAKKLLGKVHIFPEDPKALWLNREGFKDESLWRQIEMWKQKLESGSLSIERAEQEGKRFDVLVLEFPVISVGKRPLISRIKIWVDPDSRLPLRRQGFVKGRQDPVLDYRITKLNTNKGLEPEDIEFQGLSLWSFPANFVSSAEGLDQLEFQPIEKADQEPRGFNTILDNFASEAAKIKDYKAEMSISQRYKRIKLAGKMTSYVIKDPFFFLFEFKDEFRTNHLGMASAGTKVCYYRDKRSYASLGGGAMRLVGVQLMHVDDPRSDFIFGESLYTLNIYSLLDHMMWFKQNGETGSETVMLDGKPCPRAIMKNPARPKVGMIQDVNVVFDPDTWLPKRVEYLGYGLEGAFGLVEYNSIKINPGLSEEELRFE